MILFTPCTLTLTSSGPVERILGDLPNVHLIPPQEFFRSSIDDQIAHHSDRFQAESRKKRRLLGKPVLVMRDTMSDQKRLRREQFSWSGLTSTEIVTATRRADDKTSNHIGEWHSPTIHTATEKHVRESWKLFSGRPVREGAVNVKRIQGQDRFRYWSRLHWASIAAALASRGVKVIGVDINQPPSTRSIKGMSTLLNRNSISLCGRPVNSRLSSGNNNATARGCISHCGADTD